MDSWEVRIDYLRERARNQLTVLFNHIARYDAASNFAVARAAKKDSTSMKSIAIMTMVFHDPKIDDHGCSLSSDSSSRLIGPDQPRLSFG